MTATPLRIDFVSDIACPWCVIGLRSLLQALADCADKAAAEIHLQPFELNPDMGAEGENAAQHVERKYGSSPERSTAIRELITEHGKALGFSFNYGPESRIWNTFDAHRLLHWAELEKRGLSLKQALFKLTFTDQRPTSDHAALLDAVSEAGLDVERARAILQTDEFALEVRRAEHFWQSQGIGAVPSIIFNQHWLIQGGQPPEVFAQVIGDIISGKAKQA